MGRNRKWTPEKLTEEARGCNTRKEFKDKNPAAYGAAYTYGMLDELGLPPHKWYEEKTKKEADKYTSRNAFKLGSPSAYQAAWRNRWLDKWFENAPH